MKSLAAVCFKESREQGLPLPLLRAVEALFQQKEMIFHLAEKGGFSNRKVITTKELQENYLDFLGALEKLLGNDVVAVIEARVIQEIELINATDCPIYEFELKRREQKYAKAIPATLEHARS